MRGMALELEVFMSEGAKYKEDASGLAQKGSEGEVTTAMSVKTEVSRLSSKGFQVKN